MENDFVLVTKHVFASYGEKLVLEDINLEIPQGVLAAIIGPNGAGKTTLLKIILKLIQSNQGEVIFPTIEKGKIVNQIAYVPQSSSVDWDFPITVLDVVVMGRYGHLGLFRRVGKKEREMAIECLAQVGMQEYSHRRISQLSGGQKQRVFLARALVQDAPIYIMDEPFKGVDIQTEERMIKILKELKEQKKTIIVVHHDLKTVTQYFDWVTLLNKKIVKNGIVEDVFTKENIAKTYGYIFGGANGND